MEVPIIRTYTPSYHLYPQLNLTVNYRLQIAAIPLLDLDHVQKEKIALQRHFKHKRDHILARLKAMGLEVKIPPTSTFYIWLDLEPLPEPLNNGLTFFEEMLKEKAIVVPGVFFDINPAHRRNLFNSPCHHFVRLSFGPPLDQLDKGLDAIERILHKVRQGVKVGEDYVKSPVQEKHHHRSFSAI
jgi:aspartate/methionine/tyrosine aminotransferase